MKDKELYKQILGLPSPWQVANVELHVEKEEVDIEIIYNSKKPLS
ncbi:hypothetical protein [Caldithrix abyssi]|uniref:Mobile element protein n=1 Tax=Caldithrix abyssi DSM 13497 TaxID=880073 RepID=A0A1J1CCI2_CALAY|nr:hypothetical protein [Caldithrix abyssi]APF19706.1 Mobile element protein [Caldithrix abyssi DSM 13497]